MGNLIVITAITFVTLYISKVDGNVQCNFSQRKCDVEPECWYDNAKEFCVSCHEWVCNENEQDWKKNCQRLCPVVFNKMISQKTLPTFSSTTPSTTTTKIIVTKAPWWKWVLPFGVAAVLMIIIIILVLALCIRRQRKKTYKKVAQETVLGQQAPGERVV